MKKASSEYAAHVLSSILEAAAAATSIAGLSSQATGEVDALISKEHQALFRQRGDVEEDAGGHIGDAAAFQDEFVEDDADVHLVVGGPDLPYLLSKLLDALAQELLAPLQEQDAPGLCFLAGDPLDLDLPGKASHFATDKP